MYRTDKHRRIVESLRVMLAIIAGLLMLDERQEGRQELSIAVIAFSIYAITLLWQAANGSLNAQRRVYYWLDSCWFLLLLYLRQFRDALLPVSAVPRVFCRMACRLSGKCRHRGVQRRRGAGRFHRQ